MPENEYEPESTWDKQIVHNMVGLEESRRSLIKRLKIEGIQLAKVIVTDEKTDCILCFYFKDIETANAFNKAWSKDIVTTIAISDVSDKLDFFKNVAEHAEKNGETDANTTTSSES